MKWRTVARWLRSHSVTPEEIVADGGQGGEAESLVTDRVRALIDELVRHVDAVVDDFLR